jgi:hypothetical protein
MGWNNFPTTLSPSYPKALALDCSVISLPMAADRAEEYGRRNRVPGELVVRIKPTKVRKAFNLAE